jgi:DNA-binding NarL/FixJ family response regulator
MEFLNSMNWRRGQPIHEIERNLILLNDRRGLTNQDIAIEINREVKTVKRWLNVLYNWYV